MFLSRIRLDPNSPEARRDLSDPYQLHSTLCRAFSAADRKCSAGAFLWRLEPETDPDGIPRVLVQSRTVPDWSGIRVRGWLIDADPAINLKDRLQLEELRPGRQFRFRLRANPCVTRNGKRVGLLRAEEQEAWLERKGELHGFCVARRDDLDPIEPSQGRIDVRISQDQMCRGRQHCGNGIHVFSVLYDGMLTVSEPEAFREALQTGIGHGKVMGLGLLSVLPAT